MRHRLSRAVYRVLLRICVRDLQRSHGAEMERLFSELIDQEMMRAGLTACVSAWIRSLYDAIGYAISRQSDGLHLRRRARPLRRRCTNVLESTVQLLRAAFRSLKRSRSFTLAAISALALGIGAATAIFTVANAVLLRPLPYPSADQIVTVWESNRERGSVRSLVAPPTFMDLREHTRAFSHTVAVGGAAYELTGGARPERVDAVMASPGVFSLLGVPMEHGNGFPVEAEQPGDDRLAVLSFGFWQRWFGGDKGVIGGSIVLDEQEYRVVGVLPADFWFWDDADLWTPLSLDSDDLTESMRGARYLQVLARVAPGTSLEQARSEVAGLADMLGREHPNNAGWNFELLPLNDHLLGEYRRPFTMLLVAVAFVLCIACANAANLVMARGSERRLEAAVRQALGAGRARLYAESLAENLMLALGAGLLGTAIAYLTVAPLARLAPEAIPRIDAVSVDAIVVTFSLLLSVAVSLVLTIVAGLSGLGASRDHALRVAGAHTGERERNQVRRWLIVAEVGLSLILLVGAGLLVRSFVRLIEVDPGFRTDGVIAASLSLPNTRYLTPQERSGFYARLTTSLEQLDGVRAVGATTNLPMSGSSMRFGFAIDGRPDAELGEQLVAQYHASTPGYFHAMGMSLRGRPFLASDNKDETSVVIINEFLAQRFWPAADPIGERITVVSQGGPVSREIVGVVADVRHRGLASDPRMEVYVPLAQDPWPFVTFVLETSSDVAVLGPRIRDQVALLDPGLPLSSCVAIDHLIAGWHAPLRFQLTLVTVFGSLALAMTALGIYGVISYMVSRRTNEIGIRMALGARIEDVFRSVVRQGFLLAVGGVLVGVGGALALTRYLSSVLYETSPVDSLTFATVSVLVVLVAVLACVVPARHATRVDPMTALRTE